MNAIQSVLPGSQSHDKTNVNATLGEPPGNLSHNEMNANATQGALPGSQSHDGTNVDATQGSPPGNSDRTKKKNKELLLRKREEQLAQQAKVAIKWEGHLEQQVNERLRNIEQLQSQIREAEAAGLGG